MVFAIYTAFNMSATFLPVYIMTHITDSFGMEKGFAASLPIMVNIFVMGVMSLFCSKLVQKMDVVKKYGEDRAMGVYNFTENIGESLGPVVFGKLMFVTPLNLIVSAFGGAVALLGVFHMFLNRRKKNGTKEIN